MKTILFILTLALSLNAYSQNVGINNPTPAQKLDVNGKIVLSDDATTPTEGTIRYNSTLKQHEGFNGTEWVSLSAKATGVFPANRVPVYGYQLGSIGQQGSLSFRRMSDDGGFFQQVPVGKFLIITNIFANSNNLGTTGNLVFTIGPDNTINSFPNTNTRFLYNAPRTTPYYLNSSAGAPLHIIKAGNYYNINVEPSSSASIDIRVQGFLVDDLNY